MKKKLDQDDYEGERFDDDFPQQMSQIREVPEVEDVLSNLNHKEPQDGKS